MLKSLVLKLAVRSVDRSELLHRLSHSIYETSLARWPISKDRPELAPRLNREQKDPSPIPKPTWATMTQLETSRSTPEVAWPRNRPPTERPPMSKATRTPSYNSQLPIYCQRLIQHGLGTFRYRNAFSTVPSGSPADFLGF
ncbi:hypothetical protein RvY_14305 [Ramazzottius varieornatus]|uniref:Uncharacterized protein n=1 Tax=Ramazzottius varieornatus TaxID=947166 RepID=A0A1D1VQT7_RAMVA|nr:hypothetical protein RvY_14305 [Ramazzottius varieornatus]